MTHHVYVLEADPGGHTQVGEEVRLEIRQAGGSSLSEAITEGYRGLPSSLSEGTEHTADFRNM